MTSLLEIHRLRSGYGSATDALIDVSITIDTGAAVGVVGANGAGKSTLMKTLAGLVPVRSGDVLLDGIALNRERADARLRRGLVLLPEGHRVMRTLTVEENLRLAAISRWPGGVRARLAEVLPTVYELFPVLHERRRQLAGLLSGGEQQMVSIGRALISQPRLLLLDEPSLGLAPVVIDRIYDSLLTLRETGLSLLVVEQNLGRLKTLCDHIHVLRLGEVTLSTDSADLSDDAIKNAYFGQNGTSSTGPGTEEE